MTQGLVAGVKEDLERGQAVVVVGAGVSLAATKGHPHASWSGLLEAGIDFCVANDAALPEGWADSVRDLLRLGDTPSLVAVADLLTIRLGGRDGGEYHRFLRQTVGSLSLVDDAVPQAVMGLGVPVVTTNYDSLLEDVSGWDAVTWNRPATIQRVLRGDEQAIVHLHGHWQEPESVVLGISSYEAVLGNVAAQGLQRAVAAMRTLVFVGTGSGVDDPNFRALRTWLASAFSWADYRHFRLCLEDEAVDLAEHHQGERIVPVPYGQHQEDLVPFLRSLAPAHPPPGIVAAAPAHLPGRRRTVDREAEVAAVVANLLADPAPPTVVLGAPGIGKTNLTLTALDDPAVSGRYGDRRHFLRCEDIVTATGLSAELAAAVGIASPVAEPIFAACALLAKAPAIVALDSADVPWAADTLATEDVFATLAAVPGVALVASIRGIERPGGPPWAQPVRLGPLTPDIARTLFLGIAGNDFDDPELDSLLADMGGIPLALELLARVAEGEPDVVALADRWHAERTNLLRKGTADHRLLSVGVSLETAWASPLLTDGARRLLCLLGALPGGVARPDLGDLLPGGFEAANVLRRRALAFHEAGRLRTHPPLRHHLAAAHTPSPDDWHRAVNHYIALFTDVDVGVGKPPNANAHLVAESANVRAVLGALGNEGEPPTAINIADALAVLNSLTGGTGDASPADNRSGSHYRRL